MNCRKSFKSKSHIMVLGSCAIARKEVRVRRSGCDSATLRRDRQREEGSKHRLIERSGRPRAGQIRRGRIGRG